MKPGQRSLEDDMKLQTNVMNYGGNGVIVSAPSPAAEQKPACGCQHKHEPAAATPAITAAGDPLVR